MGINVVIGCEQCHEKVWAFRGYAERAYREMRGRHPSNHRLLVSDDQRGGWAEDDSRLWRRFTFGPDGWETDS